MCTHVCIYVYIYMCVCIYTYIHLCVCTYKWVTVRVEVPLGLIGSGSVIGSGGSVRV